jgi:hypothetical protein
MLPITLVSTSTKEPTPSFIGLRFRLNSAVATVTGSWYLPDSREFGGLDRWIFIHLKIQP